MGIVKYEDVVGYRVGEELVCADCLSIDEESQLRQEDVLTEDRLDDEYVFCDRCGRRID